MEKNHKKGAFHLLLENQEKYEKEIKKLKFNHQKEIQSTVIEVTKDIINSVIISKLKKAIDQFSNEEIANARKTKEEDLKEICSQKEVKEEAVKSILDVLGANFKDRKEVISLRRSTIEIGNSSERIIATISDGKLVELGDDEINAGKMYLELIDEIKECDLAIKKIYNSFDEQVKNLSYEEIDFEKEIKELNLRSKLSINNLYQLEEDDHIKLFGLTEDFENYKNSILKIKMLLKKLNEEFKVIY